VRTRQGLIAGLGSRELRSSRDRAAVAALAQVLDVFENEASWYNNASFLLPFVATIVVGAAGLVTRRADVLGFAAFLGAVTLLMIPVVLTTWRRTPTAIAITNAMLVSLHHGRSLKAMAWSDVTSIRERETQGNRRWEIAAGDDDRILLDGELERLPELVQRARQLAGSV
jgi:hypothetical protein